MTNIQDLIEIENGLFKIALSPNPPTDIRYHIYIIDKIVDEEAIKSKILHTDYYYELKEKGEDI